MFSIVRKPVRFGLLSQTRNPNSVADSPCWLRRSDGTRFSVITRLPKSVGTTGVSDSFGCSWELHVKMRKWERFLIGIFRLKRPISDQSKICLEHTIYGDIKCSLYFSGNNSISVNENIECPNENKGSSAFRGTRVHVCFGMNGSIRLKWQKISKKQRLRRVS